MHQIFTSLTFNMQLWNCSYTSFSFVEERYTIWTEIKQCHAKFSICWYKFNLLIFQPPIFPWIICIQLCIPPLYWPLKVSLMSINQKWYKLEMLLSPPALFVILLPNPFTASNLSSKPTSLVLKNSERPSSSNFPKFQPTVNILLPIQRRQGTEHEAVQNRYVMAKTEEIMFCRASNKFVLKQKKR